MQPDGVPEPANLRTQGHLLASRDHALTGMPFILDVPGADPGAKEGFGQIMPVALLDTATIAQDGDKLILR